MFALDRMLYSFLSGFVSAKTASSDVPPDIPGNGISCSAGVCALCAAKWLLPASSSVG